jgi:EAL domain-containing protein (putative c-di-GMP-specific phosphodiesterase class I)
VLALQTGAAFRVVRQPIMRLSDERPVGWEMLSRGPAGIFEMPRDFFRLALEHKLLTQVDLHCLDGCIRAALDLGELSRRHVNLFPSTLLDVPIGRIIDMFPRGSAAASFCIEISEQQFIGEPSLLREQVRALKGAGIRVAIDDVGFGRSSLETLILLEPDVVKIDRAGAFSARDADMERSLRRMVGVVASMESEAVAEGIESREDLELLREIGVTLGQGVLWGDPVGASGNGKRRT